MPGLSGWQPMETAPRNGTDVLIWDDRCVVAHYATGKAMAGLDPADVKDGVQWATSYWSPYSDYAPPVHSPTYWMPLPEPPVMSDEQIEGENPHAQGK